MFWEGVLHSSCVWSQASRRLLCLGQDLWGRSNRISLFESTLVASDNTAMFAHTTVLALAAAASLLITITAPVHATAPTYHMQVPAQCTAAGLSNNTNWGGNDIDGGAGLPAATWGECCTACNNNASCLYYTYAMHLQCRNSSTKIRGCCHMKSKGGGGVPGAAPGRVSGRSSHTPSPLPPPPPPAPAPPNAKNVLFLMADGEHAPVQGVAFHCDARARDVLSLIMCTLNRFMCTHVR